MTAVAFDTHAYVKRLVSAGMPEPQAEVIADEQRSLMANELATKRDMKELETALKRDMKELETALKRDLMDVETRLEVKLAETKADILKWVAGLLLTQTAVIAALVKLL